MLTNATVTSSRSTRQNCLVRKRARISECKGRSVCHSLRASDEYIVDTQASEVYNTYTHMHIVLCAVGKSE